MNTENYSKTAKFFHWLIALIVILMLSGSFFLDDLPKSSQNFVWTTHKSFGLTVLWLVVIRFFWIQYSGKPSLPLNTPGWEKFLARFVQYSMYTLLVAMPICGWIMSTASNKIPSYFGLYQLPFPGIKPDKELADFMFHTHNTIAWILIGFITMHIAGALKHHWINKDNVLRSMWFR